MMLILVPVVNLESPLNIDTKISTVRHDKLIRQFRNGDKLRRTSGYNLTYHAVESGGITEIKHTSEDRQGVNLNDMCLLQLMVEWQTVPEVISLKSLFQLLARMAFENRIFIALLFSDFFFFTFLGKAANSGLKKQIFL